MLTGKINQLFFVVVSVFRNNMDICYFGSFTFHLNLEFNNRSKIIIIESLKKESPHVEVISN